MHDTEPSLDGVGSGDTACAATGPPVGALSLDVDICWSRAQYGTSSAVVAMVGAERRPEFENRRGHLPAGGSRSEGREACPMNTRTAAETRAFVKRDRAWRAQRARKAVQLAHQPLTARR